eukprot:m.170002 g.170002  ORF g.170002 m.170002 type:complete len:230 (+) comp53240_c0_seq5:56-745(+)
MADNNKSSSDKTIDPNTICFQHKHVVITTGDTTDMLNRVVGLMFGGFLIGGTGALRRAADQHITANTNTKYISQLHAQQDLNNAVLRAFIRRGLQWSWRIGVFTSIFSGVSLVSEKYRGTQDMLNIVAGGGPQGQLLPFFLSSGFEHFRCLLAVSGAICSVPSGPRAVVMGTLAATAFSTIFGGSLQILWTIQSYVQEQHQKEIDELRRTQETLQAAENSAPRAGRPAD